MSEVRLCGKSRTSRRRVVAFAKFNFFGKVELLDGYVVVLQKFDFAEKVELRDGVLDYS